MDGAVNPASIAILTSIGTSLLAGSLSVWVAIRSGKNAAVKRDTVVSILFGAAVSLTCLDLFAAARIATWGMAYAAPLKAALLLTAAFAVLGVVVGLMRGLRSARAFKTQSA